MRVPVSWLRSLCDPSLSSDELAERLAMTGTEVERVERVGVGDPANFVVGKVVSAEQHPDAERLTVCEVEDGVGRCMIVCGAPNVAAGQTVAVALPGAVMPDGTVLGEAELRGVKSSGMILAEDELGIGTDHAGILVLPDELEAGAALVEALPITDEVLELEITPNRPDCLSVYGVARELHAITADPLAPLEEDAIDGDAPAGIDVEIADPSVCLRFAARSYEGVSVGPSPAWLKARLMAAGQRPISNVVDITNYVMLLTGQPLHAFDQDKIRGGRVVVRRAAPGERITTLDDVDRELDPDMAVVCDAEGPSGIAGVMGGQISEVEEGTTRVLMEAATWVGPNILETSKKLGLRSEASGRFEKQLHPDLALVAQRVTAKLMRELCGATPVGGLTDAFPEPPDPRLVPLRLTRLERLLGVEVAAEEAMGILERLGFVVNQADAGFDVRVPYFRDGDVQREADLIEEVARVYGLDRIPTTLPARAKAVGRLTAAQQLRRRVEDALRDRGLDEIVEWSFTRPDASAKLRIADEQALVLSNPLSDDQSVMRGLLLPGLLDAAAHNAAHGNPGVRLFECARVYWPSGDLTAPEASPRGAVPAAEGQHVGALLTAGPGATWRSPERKPDFYSAKGLVGAVLGTARLEWRVTPGEWPFLHPARAGGVMVGEENLGWLGELHPLVAREWDLDGAAVFELDLDAVAALAPPPAEYRDLTSFPAVLQDIAVIVPESTPAAEVEGAVRDAAGALLRDVEVFDVYRGDQTGEGEKSLAFRLEFRAGDRTLRDEEVDALRVKIESAVAGIGGRLRA